MKTKPKNWDLECDFISVGSGGGGITAAIAVHDLGKKAVVLEKAPKLGGVTAYSGGGNLSCKQSRHAEAGHTGFL